MSSPQRYLRVWLLATIALVGAVAAFNMAVDPYGLFGLVRVQGFNSIKSQASQRAQMFKRHRGERMHPNALILGNSRAEIGFDPDSAAWPSSVRPVFNLALPGTGVFSAMNEFTNVLRTATPRLVVMGLDFLDFRADPAMADDPPPPPADRFRLWRERASALLTVNAVLDSLATIRAQHDPYPTSLNDSGFNPMRDYVGIARREGYYAMFRQRNQENARNWARGPKTIYLADGRLAPEFRALEKMMALTTEDRIAMRFVVYPYHAQTLVLFHEAGLWPAFEAWKRELAKIVAQAQSHGVDVELWDFSGFSPYADEPVPRPGDTRSELNWYWEAGHFKKALGDAMLARMFETGTKRSEWGVLVTPDNIEQHLMAERSERDAYEIAHRDEVAELRMLIDAVRTREPPVPSGK